jgi:hypothetical protein
MSVEPGNSWKKPVAIAIPLADMSKIPADTWLLAVAGADDHAARDIDAKRIFTETTQVPLSNKDFILVHSDNHGIPRLRAHHFAPCSSNRSFDSGGPARLRPQPADEESPSLDEGTFATDALDYFGYWKLLDGLTDAAFYGKNRAFALGNTAQQRFMGKWSDGRPVRELEVSDRP